MSPQSIAEDAASPQTVSPRRRWFTATIRELMLAIAILGICLAWYVDHRSLVGSDAMRAGNGVLHAYDRLQTQTDQEVMTVTANHLKSRPTFYIDVYGAAASAKLEKRALESRLKRQASGGQPDSSGAAIP